MTNQQDFLYAPNVHLFAFQYCKAFTENDRPFEVPRSWIQQQYDLILKSLSTNFLFSDISFQLRLDTPDNRDNFFLLKEEDRPFLTFNSQEKSTNKDTIILLSPQQINQTYALNFSIYFDQNEKQDEILIQRLNIFNPKECLNLETDLGQTILITSFLPKGYQAENLKNLAQQCLQNFLNISSIEEDIKLSESGTFLDSPIFEFGNPNQPNKYGNNKRYGRFLILFYHDDNASNKFRDYFYLELPHLFFYYHKIVQPFLDSKKDYKESEKLATKITKILNNLQSKYGWDIDRENQTKYQTVSRIEKRLSSQDLKELKGYLKQLLYLVVEQEKIINKLENYTNTIKSNLYNYQTLIKDLETNANSSLIFFEIFVNKEVPFFLKQIESNSNYLQAKTVFIERNINTIRSLIEIDQAERDLALERKVQGLGIGLAAGAIVASSSPVLLIEEQVYIPIMDKSFQLPSSLLNIHPFFFSLLVSLIAAVTFGGFSWLLTRPK